MQSQPSRWQQLVAATAVAAPLAFAASANAAVTTNPDGTVHIDKGDVQSAEAYDVSNNHRPGHGDMV